MFIDELEIQAKAGDGGDGVVRWRHEKFRPKAGPAGGNGGNGGDVYVRTVPDLNQLAKYTGHKQFYTKSGEPGRSSSQFGKNAPDLYIDVPVGTKVTNLKTGDWVELLELGAEKLILRGGHGGLGNETFKSSTNRAPQEATKGKPGERADFLLEVSLIADVGLIGFPSAGKSTFLNLLTNARSKVGAYDFTTLEPHLGKLYEFTIADLPGLIEGASKGKGLGDKFLRHISRTKMLLHLIDAASEKSVLYQYQAILEELRSFDDSLLGKEQWIILTKKDLVSKAKIEKEVKNLDKSDKRVFVISENDGESIKFVKDTLVKHLREGYHNKSKGLLVPL